MGRWTLAVSVVCQVVLVLNTITSSEAIVVGCYNSSTCDFMTEFVIQNIDANGDSQAAAKQFCCDQHGATLYAFDVFNCFQCPPKITSVPSSESSENLANRTVSLGKASDVVARLHCGVGPTPTALQRPPTWVVQDHPALQFVQDNTVVEVSSVLVADSGIALECNYVHPVTPADSVSVGLTITSENLFFTREPPNVAASGSIQLDCPVPDLPNRSITWFNARTLAMIAENEAIPNTPDEYYFCQVDQGDRGTYNSRNIAVSNSIPSDLTLDDAVTEILVAPGGDVQLSCNTDGSTKQWLYNGQVIDPPSNDMLTNVSLSQSGFYQCHVDSLTLGNKITSTYVNVVDIQLLTSRKEFKVGNLVELSCSVRHAVPEMGQLNWYKGSSLVSSDSRASVSYNRMGGVSTADLTIRNAAEADSGEYRCRADLYIAGATSPVVITTTISVDDPPRPPLSVAITTTTVSAMVSWSANPANSDIEILSYLVKWWQVTTSEESATYVVVPMMPGEMAYTLSIPGLSIFTNYVVQIASTDRRCNSTFSPESAFQTQQGTPANMPEGFVATAIHHNIVELTWNPPNPPLNGIITRYRITYRETSAGPLQTAMTSEQKLEVPGLKPETRYTFSVEAGTSAGFGPQTADMTVTTIREVRILNPQVTPQSNNTLSSTVSVEFNELQVNAGSQLSHYWLAVLKLPKSSCTSGISGSHPDTMFPHEDNFTSQSSAVEGKSYVAAEISAAQMSFPFTFVFGDNSNSPQSDNGYVNAPLDPQSCYTFFMRGFTDITVSRRRKDVSQRRYRSYVSSQFMTPVETLPATAWLQIRFSPVLSCSEWTNDATTRRDEILAILATQINSACSCSFSTTDFTDSAFSCRNPKELNEESVVLKALVQETNGYSAPAAVAVVSAWRNSGPSITVDVSSFEVCASCETSIVSKDSEDCRPCNPQTETNYTIIIVGVVAGTFVIVLVLLIVIIVIIAVCKYRSGKHKNAYNTDERDNPCQTKPHETPIVIENAPPHSERPLDIDGKRYSDMRPQVVGGSATDLPVEFIPYPVYPMPPPEHTMHHHASSLSLSSGGNATPNNYPHMSTLYPHMARPIPPGMIPVAHTPVPHPMPTHQRSKSSDMDVQQMGMTPSHSRQPSDVTVLPDPRRQYEYMYYPYAYYPYYPYHHHMPSSSGYASPSSRRMMMSERDLERHHLAGSGYSTPHLPRRPHTADMLEADFARGGSPMLYHRPQESIISQPEQVVHPFPRRGMKMHSAFSTSHLPSKPVEGDSTMERFINEQLKSSQQHLPQQRQREQLAEGGTTVGNSYQHPVQPTNVSVPRTDASDVGSLSSVQPGSGSIESEVL